MGVDYTSIGGIGIYITDEMIEKIEGSGKFTEEDLEDDMYSCLDSLGIDCQVYGSAYSGEESYCFLVDGETFDDVNKNKDKFIKKLSGIGIVINESDLVIVAALHVW